MAILQSELRILYQRSGNRCAFERCRELLTSPVGDVDEPAVLGHVAHIVGQSRQGPRGEHELAPADRDRAPNLMLLCLKHHKLIDTQPQVYTVLRLREMKAAHEAAVEKATGRVVLDDPPRPGVTEPIHSNLLAVVEIPSAIYSAASVATEAEVRQQARWPAPPYTAPFVVRADRLYAFTDLGLTQGPFAGLVDRVTTRREHLGAWWSDPDRTNWFLTLFNRALIRLARQRDLEYHHQHRRFHFGPATEGGERVVSYQPLNQRWATRTVAHRPRSKKHGTELSFWLHAAVKLKVIVCGPGDFVISIQPDLWVTRDGHAELPASEIGEKVTRRKARWFNYETLGHVNFWRDYLCAGSPRIVLPFSQAQRFVIDSTLMATQVTWPGIPEEHAKPFTRVSYHENLFSWAEELGIGLEDDDEESASGDRDPEHDDE